MSTDHDIRAALKKRCAPPAWALFEEVRNSAGHSATRSADAIAMSLWPSRGLELHGFEVKASRSDWLRELKNPQKAEAIHKFCDRWWLVAGDETIVRDGELPPTWGLLVLRGSVLVTAREADKREAEPVSRHFLAALLRRAHEVANPADMVPTAEVEARVAKAIEERLPGEIRMATRDLQDKAERVGLVEQLEAAIDQRLGAWNFERIKAALRLAHVPHHAHAYASQLEAAARNASMAATELDALLKKVRGFEATDA